MRPPGAFGVRLQGRAPFLLASGVLPNADGAVLASCADVDWLAALANEGCGRSEFVIEGCPERFCECAHGEAGTIVFLGDVHGYDVLRVGANQRWEGISCLLIGQVPC